MGQIKKYKRTNNDLQNIHIKLKIEKRITVVTYVTQDTDTTERITVVTYVTQDTVTTERITVVTYVTQDTDTTERITVVTNDTQGQGEKNLNKR
jgi:LysM repeat protein